MRPLTIHCFVDTQFKDKTLKKYKAEMKPLYPCNFIITPFNGKLETETRNGAIYATDDYITRMTTGVKADMVMFFVSEKKWRNGTRKLFGYKLGKMFNGMYVMATKDRKDYYQTAEHELLHAIDDYTKYWSGIRLEDVLGVKDFDDDIVHNQLYWKDQDYKYDDVWKKIAPVLSKAIAHKRPNRVTAQLISALQALKQTYTPDSSSIDDGNYRYFLASEIVGLQHELVKKLDDIRHECGFPFKITSGLRSKEQNAKLKNAVEDSAHVSGKAVDIHCIDSKKRLKIVDVARKHGVTRLGIGKTFLHIDVDTSKPQEVMWHYY